MNGAARGLLVALVLAVAACGSSEDDAADEFRLDTVRSEYEQIGLGDEMAERTDETEAAVRDFLAEVDHDALCDDRQLARDLVGLADITPELNVALNADLDDWLDRTC